MIIESRSNPLIKDIIKLSRDASFRRERGLFVCEGFKLYEEAKKSGIRIVSVLYESGLPEPDTGERVVTAPRGLLEAASTQQNPEGIVFVCEIPDEAQPKAVPPIIALEQMQDPGNIGTILRCADAFSIPLVCLIGNCADIYNPKAVRASMGSVFRVKTMRCSHDEFFEAMNGAGIKTYASVPRDDAKEIQNAELKNAAVIIGNESAGITAHCADRCCGSIKIPMSGQAESLNASAAASIIMWEMSG